MTFNCRFVYETEKFSGVAELLEILGRFVNELLVCISVFMSIYLLNTNLFMYLSLIPSCLNPIFTKK